MKHRQPSAFTPSAWRKISGFAGRCVNYFNSRNGERISLSKAARRTFWEKAMLVHEENFRPADKPRKVRLARHYYDLWCLINKGVAAQAMADSGLFQRVAAHREIFFRWSWVDYSTLRHGSLRLIPSDDQLAAWRQDYQIMRGEMFFGDVPKFDAILRVVGDFEKRFNQSAPV